MVNKTVMLTGSSLDIEEIHQVAYRPETTQVAIAPSAFIEVERSRAIVNEILNQNVWAYGINSGFGSLSTVVIPIAAIQHLNYNLALSHAIAVGEPLPLAVVRAALVVRINTLIRGHSGIRSETIKLLLELLNRNITPIIPSLGSANQDLCFLSYVALSIAAPPPPLDGGPEKPQRVAGQKGEERDVFVVTEGKKMPSEKAFQRVGLEKVVLQAKEVLAITNGSTFAAAYSALLLRRARGFFSNSIGALAMSFEAMHGASAALHPALHAARRHEGQQHVAFVARALLKGSLLVDSEQAVKLQDGYSLRCAPQVQGPLLETLEKVEGVIVKECNASTDNPLLFVSEEHDGEDVYGGADSSSSSSGSESDGEDGEDDAQRGEGEPASEKAQQSYHRPVTIIMNTTSLHQQASHNKSKSLTRQRSHFNRYGAYREPKRRKGGLKYLVLSGGNFHGEPIGQAVDHLKISLAKVAAISERRQFRILDASLSGLSQLPFLTPKQVVVRNTEEPSKRRSRISARSGTHGGAGVNSGYMITQYTAASLVLQIQKLAAPNSVYSLPTCANQEDLNSNAWNGVLDLAALLDLCEDVVAFEYLLAARALWLLMVAAQEKELEEGDAARAKGHEESWLEVLGVWTRGTFVQLRKGALKELKEDHLLNEEARDVKRIVLADEFVHSIMRHSPTPSSGDAVTDFLALSKL